MKSKGGGGYGAIPVEHLERMASVLRLLAHPQRLRVVEHLERARSAPVHAITARLGLPQAAVSQHLNLMRRVGLVRADRRGREVWYAIGDARALTILGCIRRKQGGNR